MSKATPGSWKAERKTAWDGYPEWLVYEEVDTDLLPTGRRAVAFLRRYPVVSESEDQAAADLERHAHLIAAAPRMLKALEAIVKHSDSRLTPMVAGEAFDAIAKAKGG